MTIICCCCAGVQYTLETFTENRSTSWDQEPYKGFLLVSFVQFCAVSENVLFLNFCDGELVSVNSNRNFLFLK